MKVDIRFDVKARKYWIENQRVLKTIVQLSDKFEETGVSIKFHRLNICPDKARVSTKRMYIIEDSRDAITLLFFGYIFRGNEMEELFGVIYSYFSD